MFLDFFYLLKQNGIPVSLREYLDLLEGVQQEVSGPSIDEFYYLAKATLVKHEGQLDRFDVLFGQYFRGKQGGNFEVLNSVPEDWLRKHFERELTDEEKAMVESLGGLEKLIERFKKIWDEQQEQHEGGNKWIGTGGTSPFGNSGYNPEGFRIGGEGGNRRAIKVWEQRRYQNLDDQLELNTRSIKLALRQLRILTREGRPTELDLDGTIRKTSDNAGMLDIKMVPSRKNRVKVLMLLDIGGSMDDHVRTCSELFSAARYEFKHLEHYYFHNCLYEYVWKDNRRRFSERIPTWQLLHSYPKDYKVIFVGDAAMSPIELTHQGGSVEHWNEEPGFTWLQRVKEQYPAMAWINPTPQRYWDFYESTQMIRQFVEDRMFPLTLQGLGDAMKELKKV
jgi:uncharacterized protein with von Willebrand factor type A (vWA) domain